MNLIGIIIDLITEEGKDGANRLLYRLINEENLSFDELYHAIDLHLISLEQ